MPNLGYGDFLFINSMQTKLVLLVMGMNTNRLRKKTLIKNVLEALSRLNTQEVQ